MQLEPIIEELKRLRTFEREGDADRFEEVLALLGRRGNPEMVAPLATVLTDDCPMHDLMEEVVRLMASFGAPSFTEGVVAATADCWPSAPGWTVALHKRVLADRGELAPYADAVRALSPAARAAAAAVLERIAEDPELADRVDEVQARLG